MSQPDYSRYTLEDFLFDDEFRRWLFQPDAAQDKHWQQVSRQHPHLTPLMDQARQLLPALRVETDALPAESRERIWATLDARFEDLTGGKPRTLKPNFRRVWAVAASVALVILTAGWWLLVRPAGRETIRTAYGETTSVTLPDGSVVKLNGNSILKFSRSWNDHKTREVWLEGEGFFTVSKRQGPTGRLKFVTHTPNLDISVLGTQFNVNTRQGSTAVTLVEGKVQLIERRTDRQRVIELRPGQQARLSGKTPDVKVSRVRTELHAAWTRNQFVFEDTPLRDIGAMLRDTYGLELVFPDDELASRRFTGNLSRQNLDTLLDVIAATYDLEISRTDNRVDLHRKQ